MRFDPVRHHRRTVRLRGFDYRQAGTYFVTICTHARESLLGDIANGELHLSQLGKIATNQWISSNELRPEIVLDEFVVMPNHVHGIVILAGDSPGIRGEGGDAGVGAHGRAPLRRSPRSLGSFIAGFKAASAKRVNEARGAPGAPVWQRSYYEHIMRGEADLTRIRQYIRDNPARWELDEYHPNRGAGRRAQSS